MSMNPHMRVGLSVLGCLAIGSCSSGTSDATGPGESPPTVTLTASQTRVTTPGDIILSASAIGANGAAVQRVEFYEQIVSVDASPRKIGEDLETPYEMKRSIVSAAENGDLAFSAKGYDVAGHVGLSNSAMVTVAVPSDNTPLQATVTASHTRITTPGRIKFIISANKPVARAEIYVGATKVADVIAPTTTQPASVSVTRADNGTHAYVVKVYDPEGNVVESPLMTVEVDIRWEFVRTIDGFHSRYESLIATDAMNAVYVAGTTDTRDVFLVKHDADGNRLWVRYFGGQDWENANSVGVDPLGRVYVAGWIYHPGATPNQPACFLAIYDPAGALVRTQEIKGISADHADGCFAASDASGNFYAAGHTADSTQGHLFVVKYDRDGNALWTRKFRGDNLGASEFPTDELTTIAVDVFGGVYVGGFTGLSLDGSPNRGPRDLFVLKYDADGNRVWSRQYGSAGVVTFGLRLAADPEGGVYFTGYSYKIETYFTLNNSLLVRYGPDGTQRWITTFDGGYAHGVTADLRGVYVVGNTSGSGITEPKQGAADVFLAKFARSGDLFSVRLLGTPISESADGVAIGLNGDVYVAAGSVYDPANSILTPILARHREVAP